MKLTTILKGCLGLVLIYLVCLPIVSIAQTVQPLQSKKVEFSPTGRARSISPDEKEFIDGYFSIDSGECLAKQRGLLKV